MLGRWMDGNGIYGIDLSINIAGHADIVRPIE